MVSLQQGFNLIGRTPKDFTLPKDYQFQPSSSIRLEATFLTNLPTRGTYSLQYKAVYGTNTSKWQEEIQKQTHKS